MQHYYTPEELLNYTPEQLLEQADESGDIDKSEACRKQAADAFFQRAEMAYRLISNVIEKRDHEKETNHVRNDYKKTTELDPLHALAFYKLGCLHYKDNSHREAQNYLRFASTISERLVASTSETYCIGTVEVKKANVILDQDQTIDCHFKLIASYRQNISYANYANMMFYFSKIQHLPNASKALDKVPLRKIYNALLSLENDLNPEKKAVAKELLMQVLDKNTSLGSLFWKGKSVNKPGLSGILKEIYEHLGKPSLIKEEDLDETEWAIIESTEEKIDSVEKVEESKIESSLAEETEIRMSSKEKTESVKEAEDSKIEKSPIKQATVSDTKQGFFEKLFNRKKQPPTQPTSNLNLNGDRDRDRDRDNDEHFAL